jgi:hypothetical protein
MNDPSSETPRYLGIAIVIAPLVSGLLGSVMVGAALTGGASRWPIDPTACLLVAIFALPIAFAHMLFLGAPLYLALARRWQVRWWSAIIWGFLVGAIPFALLVCGSAIATADNAGDIREIARIAGYAGGLGAVAGLVFRAVLVLGERAKRKGGPLPDRPSDVCPEADA